jgi:hypothetical protein
MKLRCIRCDELKGLNAFYSGRTECKECRKKYHRAYHRRNRKWLCQKAVLYRRQRKLLVLKHYSKGKKPRCRCCKVTTLAFLTLDHIKGRGNKDREKFGEGATFYQALIRRRFPKGFQVLCGNCQMGKLIHHGFCPHHPKIDLRLNGAKPV